MDDVKIIKLINGEEIVCECRTDSNNHYIANAMQVVPVARDEKTGKISVTIVPWAPLVKDGIEIAIEKSHVIFCEVANDETSDGHRDFFSDIVVPESKIIH